MIDVYKILSKTTVEGPGTRFCIWTQGCKKHCKDCFAKETWDFNCGQKYSIDDIFEQIKSVQNEIEGVTFLGGEPFEQAKELSILAKMIKEIGLSIVCFTGYTIEELKNKSDVYVKMLLNNVDLLIDGGFEQDKFDLSRPWVGSSNQRYLFLTDFYNEEKLNSFKNKIEVHVSKDGRVEINGMGDFKAIENKFCLQLGANVVE